MKQSTGFFVTIEGVSGAGKSTIVAKLKDKFLLDGKDILFTKEPTPNFNLNSENDLQGVQLFSLLLDDREQHINNQILPTLDKKQIVISDRYIMSSLVFQRMDGLELDYIWAKNSLFPVPNLTIVLTIDEETATQRLNLRANLSRLKKPGVRINEVEFTNDAINFLKLRNWNIQVIVNMDKSIDFVVEEVYQAIIQQLQLHENTSN